jgi:putative hydrolase of the HAD superfamily
VIALDAVIFDLDDTLHDDTFAYHSAARATAAEVAGRRAVSAHTLYEAYVANAEAFWRKLSREDLATQLSGRRTDLWLAALNSAGAGEGDLARWCSDRYNQLRKDHLRLFPGAVELLAHLRGHGLKLGLLTNGFAETHREKIALLAIEQFFDSIFIADEVGLLKPDPAIFLHACEEMGVAPGRTAMVGDRYDRDIIGAHEAGLFTVWINLHAEPVPSGAPQPDSVVEATADVGEALLALFKDA